MILPNLREERKLWKRGWRRLAGVDEVGRGALAGPVVAAAVLLQKPKLLLENPPPFEIKDSKRLQPAQRERIYRWVRSHPGFSHATCAIPARTIDRINIRQASLRAMERAVQRLHTQPRLLLIDGIDTINSQRRQRTYIKGDSRVFLIALASIVAKVKRDRIMTRFTRKYPGYQFETHKGYGTRLHRRAIRQNGLSPIHRKTFL